MAVTRHSDAVAPLRSAGPVTIWFGRHGRTASASFRRLVRQPFASLMIILVIAVTLAIPAALNLVIKNFTALSSGWDDALDFSVFLDTGVSESEAEALARLISQRADVDDVRLANGTIRRCRHALEVTKRAVQAFKSGTPALVLHLGNVLAAENVAREGAVAAAAHGRTAPPTTPRLPVMLQARLLLPLLLQLLLLLLLLQLFVVPLLLLLLCLLWLLTWLLLLLLLAVPLLSLLVPLQLPLLWLFFLIFWLL